MEESVKLNQFSLNRWEQYELGERDWPMALENEREDYSFPSFSLNISFKHKADRHYGNHLLIKSHFKGHYTVSCVRCLKTMRRPLNFSFQGIFLSESKKGLSEYKDTLGLWIEGEEYELYFQEKGKVYLKNFIYEQLTTNLDPFPLHAPDCLGLCQICGVNLNEKNCKHFVKPPNAK